MHSDSESSTFRESIQKFVFEKDIKPSPLRTSRGHQQKPAYVEPTTGAEEQKLLDISPRKRKLNQESYSKSEESPSPSKRLSRSPKRKRGYAPPEAYAHLRELNDCIKMHLDVLFVGINPGVLSATVGHHFAHPSNRFYKALHGSGLTGERVDPSEDYTLPDRYNIGITNLVDRPSASADQLKKAEFRESTPALLQRIAKYRPRIVCFVGMGMYTEVEKILDEKAKDTESPKKKLKREIVPGLRPYKLVYLEKDAGPVEETLFFSSPSTSGLAAAYQEKDLIQLYTELRKLVCAHKDKTIGTSAMQIVPTPLAHDDMQSPTQTLPRVGLAKASGSLKVCGPLILP